MIISNVGKPTYGLKRHLTPQTRMKNIVFVGKNIVVASAVHNLKIVQTPFYVS